MLVKPTDALIHFGYTRYFHYYRIQKALEALCYDLVLKVELRFNQSSHFLSFIKSTSYFVRYHYEDTEGLLSFFNYHTFFVYGRNHTFSFTLMERILTLKKFMVY